MQEMMQEVDESNEWRCFMGTRDAKPGLGMEAGQVRRVFGSDGLFQPSLPTSPNLRHYIRYFIWRPWLHPFLSSQHAIKSNLVVKRHQLVL